MREAIGGTWIFSIVIVFIVLFTSYLALSVNYSKAFRVKNGVISLIEKNEGIKPDLISKYLNGEGYAVYGVCNEETAGEGYDRSTSSTTDRFRYCIKKVIIYDNNETENTLDKNYYKVTVFFRIDLPILGNIFTFPVTGETGAIYYADDE